MRPFVMLLTSAALATLVGCHQRQTAWQKITTSLNQLPIGMSVSEVETKLNLPAPTKTLMGSSSYHDREFVYEIPPDMTLSLGVREHRDAHSGELVSLYNGDHAINCGKQLSWARWHWEDGRMVEGWKGLGHIRPDLGDCWPVK